MHFFFWFLVAFILTMQKESKSTTNVFGPINNELVFSIIVIAVQQKLQ